MFLYEMLLSPRFYTVCFKAQLSLRNTASPIFIYKMFPKQRCKIIFYEVPNSTYLWEVFISLFP